MNNCKVVPFEPWHLEAMEKQPQQAREAIGRVHGEAYTVLEGKTPIVCAGFLEREGRTFAWAILSPIGPHRFVGLHRAVARALEGRGRVEAFVKCGFEAGARWMNLLGFEPVDEIEDFVHYVRA